VPVDLVGGDLQEALVTMLFGGLKQHPGAVDVGLDKGAGLEQRSVDVGLGGEVEDAVVLGGQLVHQLCVADVAPHESEPWLAL